MSNTLLMNKAPDGDPAGAAPPAKQDPPPTPPSDPPAKADGDDEYDELGYKKQAKDPVQGDQKPPGDKPAKAPAEKPEKVENPGTGYGNEEPKVEDPPPAEPPKDPPPPATDLEKKLEGLNENFAKVVKAQIEELGLQGEQLDKFVNQKKQEQKAADDWRKRQISEEKRQDQLRRAQWHKELKEDPVFGGDKFALNRDRAEKILDEYYPELKKELTGAGQILRPSVMRGLARIADALYPDRQVVQGDPPAPAKKSDDEKSDNPLDFYTN